jgi:hypothetical protein
MKRNLPLAVILIMAFASLCLAQEAQPSPSPKPKAPRVTKAQLLKQLSAMETKLWDAWKNKDAKPFEMHLAADGVMVGEEGIGSKSDVVKMMANMPCEVKSFTLTDWKLTRLNANTALLTYKGAADGTCMGTPIPTTWSSSLWVRRKGTWQAFFHQETPAK